MYTPGYIWKCQTVKVEMIYAVEGRLMKTKSGSRKKKDFIKRSATFLYTEKEMYINCGSVICLIRFLRFKITWTIF